LLLHYQRKNNWQEKGKNGLWKKVLCHLIL
jgi:hypothetical protein